MVGKMLIEINEQNFDEEVLNSHLPVFACFTASWCSSCFPTCLLADELFGEYKGKIKFVRVDIEESAETAERYHITAVPTIIVFKESLVIKKLISFQERSYLTSLLNSLAAE